MHISEDKMEKIINWMKKNNIKNIKDNNIITEFNLNDEQIEEIKTYLNLKTKKGNYAEFLLTE